MVSGEAKKPIRQVDPMVSYTLSHFVNPTLIHLSTSFLDFFCFLINRSRRLMARRIKRIANTVSIITTNINHQVQHLRPAQHYQYLLFKTLQCEIPNLFSWLSFRLLTIEKYHNIYATIITKVKSDTC